MIISTQEMQQIKTLISDVAVFPEFLYSLNTHFSGVLPLEDYMRKTYECLSPYGFEDENTMGMIASCRDEITDPLYEEVVRYWGKTFNCCSLAGFITMGRTGLAAATNHTPIFNKIRRFTFYAMPHIAISRYGEIGKVYREGIYKPSHACGALEAIVKELECGQINLEMDLQDLEQSIIRKKIISTLNDGEKPNLVEITKLACQIISHDIERLLSTLDPTIFNYAVMTGIQIHGPLDTQWIYPKDFYLVSSKFEGTKKRITVFQN